MKFKSTKMILALLIAVLFVVAIGCSDVETPESDESPWPDSIRIGSLMSGTSNYLAVASWTPLLKKIQE